MANKWMYYIFENIFNCARALSIIHLGKEKRNCWMSRTHKSKIRYAGLKTDKGKLN